MVFIRNRLPTFLQLVWVTALPRNTTAQENSGLNKRKSIRKKKHIHTCRRKGGMFLHSSKDVWKGPEQELRL